MFQWHVLLGRGSVLFVPFLRSFCGVEGHVVLERPLPSWSAVAMRRCTCFAVAPGLKVSQQALHCNKLNNIINFTCYYFKLCGSSYIKSKSSPSFLHWKTCLHSRSSRWSSIKWLILEEKQRNKQTLLKHFFYLMHVCCIFFPLLYTTYIESNS